MSPNQDRVGYAFGDTDAVRPVHLVGLDISAAFLERARTLNLDASWHRHDITVVPFPTGPADLLHARFVLSHVPDPEDLLSAWLEQLNAGGYLLVQEDEQIVAQHPVLATYEELARSLVAHRGGDLWVGSRLGRAPARPGFVHVTNRVYRHRVPVPRAAELYAMNFAVWRHDPFVTEGHPLARLDALATELDHLAGSTEAGTVVFDIRQVAYRRQ